MVGIKPGDLKRRVKFTKDELVKEDDGYMKPTPKTYLETFAVITPKSASTQDGEGKMTMLIYDEVIIRKRNGKTIETNMAVWYDDAKHLIRDIRPADRIGQFIKMTAVRE